MTFKRILCLVFALCLMVSVMSACGGDKEKTPTTTSSKTSTSGSNDTVSYLTPSYEEGSIYAEEDWDPYASMPDSIKGSTVRYATWIDQHNDIGAYTLANVYNDIGINVELYTVKQSGYVSEIMTKIASGDIPDVFITNEGATGAFPITLQIAAPINKISTVDLNEPIWDQSLLKGATIEGNTYYVNTIGNPMANGNMVFYNKRLFEENGFKTPTEYYEDGTWSWDNLLKCAKDIMSLGSEYTGIFVEMDILAGSVGASITQYDFNTHTFKSGLDDPNLLKAYQWYADAKEQGYLNGQLSYFTQGKCAIYIRGPYGLQAKGYFMNMDPEDVGYTWLPSFTEGEKGLISSIYGAHGIVTKAPNGNAAGYFLRYWMDPANWDVDNAFITIDAGNFFYQITEATADEKHFSFDQPLAGLIGYENANQAFYNEIKNSSSAGMKTALDSLSNLVEDACAEGNKLINEKIEADRS